MPIRTASIMTLRVNKDTDFKLKNREIQEKLDDLEKQRRMMEEDMLQNNRLEQRMNDIRSQLENGMIERAQLSDMIGEIRRVDVFPDYLEITFDFLNQKKKPRMGFFTILSFAQRLICFFLLVGLISM